LDRGGPMGGGWGDRGPPARLVDGKAVGGDRRLSTMAQTSGCTPLLDVSRTGGTRMHYVNGRYHWMQKQKFGVRCPITLFVESALIPANHEK
jgi:hypothetical protein